MARKVSEERWTVRGVPPEVRKAAAAAADRAALAVGPWLARAVEVALQAEREPIGVVPSGMADNLADKSAEAAARLSVVERAVGSAVSLAAARGVPTAFRKRANRLLLEALPAAGAGEPEFVLKRHRAAHPSGLKMTNIEKLQ